MMMYVFIAAIIWSAMDRLVWAFVAGAVVLGGCRVFGLVGTRACRYDGCRAV